MVRPPRIVCSLIAVFALAPLARAEAQSISFGVMAGGSLSTFTGDVVSDAKNYAGYIVGAHGDLGITNAFEAIQSGSTTNVNVKTRTVSAVAAIRF